MNIDKQEQDMDLVVLFESLFPQKKTNSERENFFNKYWPKSELDEKNETFVEKKFSREQEKALKTIFDKFAKQYRGTGFYRLLLQTETIEIHRFIYLSEIIDNKTEVFNQLVETLFLRIYTISFRILLEVYKLEDHGDTPFDEYTGTESFFLKVCSKFEEFQRLSALIGKNYIKFIKETVEQTNKYLPEIEKIFEKKLGTITDIKLSVGDTHNKGKSVCIIKFANGSKLVYKPSCVGVVSAFARVVGQINQYANDDFLTLNVGKSFFAEGHEWTEFIACESCTSKSEIRRFYRRMGEWLCILYCLNAKDFHAENVIAKGECPYLIDVETIIQNIVFRDGIVIEGACKEALDCIDNSVLKTGLLPIQIVNPKTKKKIEIGAMGKIGEQESPFITRQIKIDENGNTEIEQLHESMNFTENHPILNGISQNAECYIDEIEVGFRTTYNIFEQNNQDFKRLIRKNFENCTGRYILRSTNIYDQLIRTSVHPFLMEKTKYREVFLLKLLEAAPDLPLEVVQSELKQMLDADIPYFIFDRDGKNLVDPDGNVVYSFTRSPIQSIEEKIDALNQLDCMRQIGFIRLSFQQANTSIKGKTIVLDGNDKKEQSNRTALEWINRIIYLLEKKSFCEMTSKISHRTWLEVNFFPEWPMFVSYMRVDFYSGLTGLALLFERCNNLKISKIAKTISKELKNDLLKNIENIAKENDVKQGAFDGIYGLIYWLIQSSSNDYMVERENVLLAEKIVSNLPRTENLGVDIMSGASGNLKVLLLLKRKIKRVCNRDSDVVEQAIAIMKDWLVGQAICEKEFAFWGDERYVGYAHGTAGIVDALADYYEQYKDVDVMKLIRGGYCFVCSNFEPECNNYRRRANDEEYSAGWCHGAPGIALLQSNLIKKVPELGLKKNDLQKNCLNFIEYGFDNDFCLCHGDFGNLLILHHCARLLNDDYILNYCEDKWTELKEKYQQEIFGDVFYYTENNGLMTGLGSFLAAVLEMEYGVPMNRLLCLHEIGEKI